MISDKMKNLVDNNSVIREMFEEGKRLKKIYGDDKVFDFSLGNPNVPAPEEVKQSIVDVIENEESTMVHGYMSNSGFEDVRDAIAESINQKFETNFEGKNIIMTAGAACGLNCILKSIINPEDEVIVFAPYFSEYNNYIKNYDGVIRVVSPNVETFEPNVEELKGLINTKTKAVIVNTPNNPTGVIYSEQLIKELASVLNEKSKQIGHSVFLISDEPYRELVYDGTEVPYITKYYKDTFVVYSYSKSLSLPGERIGYVVVPDELYESQKMIEAITISNRISGIVNAPSLIQRVVPHCLKAKVNIEAYRKNRDLLYSIVTECGFETVKPEGAFYLWVKTPIDDKEFCKIAKNFNLLFVPGSSFACSGFVRIAYCVSYDMIEKSKDAFMNLSKELKINN